MPPINMCAFKRVQSYHVDFVFDHFEEALDIHTVYQQ